MRHDDVVDCPSYAVTEVVSGVGTPPRVYTELHHSPDMAEALLGGGGVTPYDLNEVETLLQEAGPIFVDADYIRGETDRHERVIAMVVVDAPLIRPGIGFDVEPERGGTAAAVLGEHPVYDTRKPRPRA